jgi:hypothetical protein
MVPALPVFLFATTKSALPSPLKSAVAIASGELPRLKLVAALKVPLPLFNRIDTVLDV